MPPSTDSVLKSDIDGDRMDRVRNGEKDWTQHTAVSNSKAYRRLRLSVLWVTPIRVILNVLIVTPLSKKNTNVFQKDSPL